MKLKFKTQIRLPRLTALSRAIGDVRPAMKDIAESMERLLRTNIAHEGLWDKWVPMRPNTEEKHRATGKPLRLLAGLADAVYSHHGSTQATYGFQTKPVRRGQVSLAELHHEGRPEGWDITPRDKKWLFFPITGKLVKPRAAGLRKGVTRRFLDVTERRISVKSGPQAAKGRKITTINREKTLRFNYTFAKKVHHPGVPARPLLPPKNVASEKAREIVEDYLTGRRPWSI